MVYTALSSVAALVLVAAAAFAPKAPILEQVTEPAREAVTTFVQPTTNLVSTFIAAPPTAVTLPTWPTASPTQAPFVATATLDITIDEPDAVVDDEAAPAPTPSVVAAPVRRPLEAPVAAAGAAPVDDQAVPDEAPADDIAAPDPTVVVEAPAGISALQIASAETPVALPPVAALPETQQQAKARMDAANQAAIDAAKATAAKAKADADAANQAAIDALKQTRADTGPEMADAVLTLPTPAAVAPALSQSAKAAANQAASEAAKLAAAKAQAEVNAANQAAIDAARAAAKPKH